MGVCVKEFLVTVITGSGRQIQITIGERETRVGEAGGNLPHQRHATAETSQKITNKCIHSVSYKERTKVK
jgi:hypothetical protein